MRLFCAIVFVAFLCGPLSACTTNNEAQTSSPLREEALDLIPFARLAASGTAPAYPLPWPREAQDALACVRDDDEASGWKVPEGPSTLEIDLMPWQGKAVALDSLSFVWINGEPTTLRVDLLSHIRGEVLVAKESPTSLFALNGEKAGALRIELQAAAGLELKSLSLLSRDGAITDYAPPRVAKPIRFQESGVIEGFYGVPWSWRERRHFIEALALNGMGSYLYAPKWDPLHRDAWREAYSPAFVRAFSELAQFAAARQVRLIFGISPLKDYDAKTEVDYDRLLSKLEIFAEKGVTDFCLLADDIEFDLARPIDAALGAEHAALALRLLNDLRAKYEGVRVSFVPTVYSDARLVSMEDGHGYLAALAALPPELGIYWTGPDTSVAAMSAADMQGIRALLGRKPILWDNYWANDGGDGLTGRLLLAALEGRSADLPAAVQGLMFNLSIQGASSRLALGTIADYLNDPARYASEAALQRTAEAETAFDLRPGQTADETALLTLFMRTFYGNAKREPRPFTLSPLLSKTSDTLAQGQTPDSATLGTLLTELVPLSGLSSALHHSALDPDLVDEWAFPMLRAEALGQAGLFALQSLNGEAKACDNAQAVLKKAQSLRFPLDSGIERFVQQACAQKTLLLAPLLKSTAEWPACIAKRPFRISPFVEASQLWVSGLPGAESEVATITFTAPQAGRYVGVMAGLAQNPLRIGLIPFELVCSEVP